MDMESMERHRRKVRFTLPDCSPLGFTSKFQTLHGTQRYINGTLITCPPATGATGTGSSSEKKPTPTINEPSLKSSLVKDSQTKIILNLRPTSTATTSPVVPNVDAGPSISAPPKTKCPPAIEKSGNPKKPLRQPKKVKSEAGKSSTKTLPKIGKKCTSLEDINRRTNSTNSNCDYNKSLPSANSGATTYNNKMATGKCKGSQNGHEDNVLMSSGSCGGGELYCNTRTELKKPIILSTVSPTMTSAVPAAAGAHSSILPKIFQRGRVRSRSCHAISLATKCAPKTELPPGISAMQMKRKSDSFTIGANGRNDRDISLINARRPSVEIAKMDADINRTHVHETESLNGQAAARTNIKLHLLTVPDFEDKYEDEINAVYDHDSSTSESTDNSKSQDDVDSMEFWSFVERWRNQRTAKSTTASVGSQSRSFANSSSIKTDGNSGGAISSTTIAARLKAFKMSSDAVPVVTTLLRASRDSNEPLLKEVFRQILDNGITKENLNATDKSGRTAISYICSTTLTKFLELFLQLPGIDVNKADNEGNTPLHFAAQAGHAEIINTLLTKSRSIIVDAKNSLGFTPLMKAALQGRTRCAKLLLFAGASPVETDSGRGLRAEQWARFCARHSCAEMIEQCARARLLDKTTSNGKWSHDTILTDKSAANNNSSNVQRNKTQQASAQTGFRSKFRKVFPFSFSLKDKNAAKQEDETYSNDLVNYLTAATLCVSGPALPAQINNKQIIKSLIRPLEVPKLEVTYANNNSIIKKYEVNNGNSQQPAIPPRGKIKK